MAAIPKTMFELKTGKWAEANNKKVLPVTEISDVVVDGTTVIAETETQIETKVIFFNEKI